jgi:hypothetical protein
VRPAKSLANVQRRFPLGLAEILNEHIAEQRTLFDGVVEGDVRAGDWPVGLNVGAQSVAKYVAVRSRCVCSVAGAKAKSAHTMYPVRRHV